MLDELLKEINELKEYKIKYECASKDKQRMSELLYDYMMQEYENTSKEKRIELHKINCCSCCRYRDCCDFEFPEDVWKPIPSEKAWIPAKTTCGSFKWA